MEAESSSDDLSFQRLYGGYVREREGAELICNDHAFLSYVIEGDCFIVRELFCEPEWRGRGFAKYLWESAQNIARTGACTHISCSVDLSARNSHDSFTLIVSRGFVPVRAESGVIVFAKEIR